MRIPRPFYALIAAGALLFTTQTADAALMLRLTDLSDATNTITITDGGAGDLTGAANGQILADETLGVWSLSTTVGTSKPNFPNTANHLQMALQNLQISSTGGGGMRIELTDTDFTLDPGFLSSLFESTGNTGGTFQVEAWLHAGNDPFGQGLSLGSLGPFTAQLFTDFILNAGFSLDDPFSLTIIATVVHPAAMTTLADSNLTMQSRPVPTPGTLPLFLAGLMALGFGMYSARRRRETAA
jgi:hypothetical protein